MGGADHGFFLVLDTSCYTTSVGIVNEQGMVVKDLRRILQVKSGERGLRQSEALFQHVKNIPQLLAEAVADTGDGLKLKAIGYSGRPRPREESYLPVFLAGENFGKALAYSAGVPAYPFTHQEGHIRAALVDTALRLTTKNKRFLGFHLSGGNYRSFISGKGRSRRLSPANPGRNHGSHAGQMLDRLGVAMGLPFPAGRHLEELAKESLRQAEGRVGGTEPGSLWTLFPFPCRTYPEPLRFLLQPLFAGWRQELIFLIWLGRYRIACCVQLPLYLRMPCGKAVADKYYSLRGSFQLLSAAGADLLLSSVGVVFCPAGTFYR